jgi:hypothetical protein
MDAQKETKLYQNALNLIRNSGIKFTVEELCKKTIMSKKTFYIAFPSKGDFAVWVYKRAFFIYDEIVSQYNNKTFHSFDDLYVLFSSFCDILTITNEKTFNLYSMSVNIKEFALQEFNKREASFRIAILNSPLEKHSKNKSLLPIIENDLIFIGSKNNYSSLLKDYISLLKGLC